MTDAEKERFYASGAWKRARLKALRRDRWKCQDCLRRIREKQKRDSAYSEKIPDAQMVHHIKELETHPALALTLSNLVSLCNDCHNKRHPEKLEGRRPSQQQKKQNPLLAGMNIYKV